MVFDISGAIHVYWCMQTRALLVMLPACLTGGCGVKETGSVGAVQGLWFAVDF